MIYDFNFKAIEKENTPYFHIAGNISHDDKILDVGCATGYFGEYLYKKFNNVELVGVDFLDFHLEKSSSRKIYSNLIKLDLNDILDQLNQYVGYFDKIILCDVLEHLNDPMNTLKILSNYLKEDGEFLIDVPNIAHASMKYRLLINNFEYQDYGILDKTHIKFFTPFTLIDALSENNFYIQSIDFIVNPPNNGYFHIDFCDFTDSVIEFIEKDRISYIFQIFVSFKKSNLEKTCIINHNNQFKEFNNLEERINKYLPDFLDERQKRVKIKSDEIHKLTNEIESMKNSNSWKLTSPLRALFKFVKK